VGFALTDVAIDRPHLIDCAGDLTESQAILIVCLRRRGCVGEHGDLGLDHVRPQAPHCLQKRHSLLVPTCQKHGDDPQQQRRHVFNEAVADVFVVSADQRHPVQLEECCGYDYRGQDQGGGDQSAAELSTRHLRGALVVRQVERLSPDYARCHRSALARKRITRIHSSPPRSYGCGRVCERFVQHLSEEPRARSPNRVLGSRHPRDN
jgi:hypothetical protein